MANIRERSDSPALEADRKKLAELESQYGDLLVDGGLAVAGAIPPPAGTVADVTALGRSLYKLDWSGAALDVLGLIPVIGDGIKGGKIAAKTEKLAEAVSAAKTALTQKIFATTRKNAEKYWSELIEKRRKRKLDKAMSRCKTEECKNRAKEKFENEMDPGRLPSDKKGSWVDANGNPVPRGTGFYRPDPEKNPSLYKALEKYGKEDVGVPFKDGHPDFSGFPPLKDGKQIGNDGKPYQVEIDMQGTERDFSSAADALKEKHNVTLSPSERRAGTWHHEPDGVTMTFVDRDIHTSYKDLETGYVNSGTPHVGGDSMWRNEDF
ncbi:HNH endonuclease [Pectobacterium aroidearum]|uniref:HNH endonuclease n=1 Tax=Pectobacterium aroidearum TaxID=1201031 RepID=A0ABR5ZAT7_9GAMM|nr:MULTISPECIES: HNH endonuclease [Pectobacterium]MBA5198904.1 HNH endonuclease [Pectobacterium aroidearum]MBA5230115.1 HNH endonuclease [Pectobacterium aroidearum]MBA5231696.1 HNH endonuclease [Pectobacterium aroidearum]MBA5739260.1 HNH endonuclease [Pectobacterium aroidearum]UXJ99840.1 HNH endonuclease [Pectobacterium aroidearum]